MTAKKENEVDSLGARLKSYETIWNEKVLDKNAPVYVRLDGRHFSKLTSSMGYPYADLENYDKTKSKYSSFLWGLMRMTAVDLLVEFKSDIVEVHSDEISLGWKEFKNVPFNGRFFKILSNIPSYASVSLYRRAYNVKRLKINVRNEGATYEKDIDHVLNCSPSFDCRMFQVPDMFELMNCFIWRQNDCIRGTINQYAQRYFSAKQLENKTIKDRIDMLQAAGHEEYMTSRDFSRLMYGSWFAKKTVELPMPEEYKKFNPGKDTVLRNTIVEIFPSQLSKEPVDKRIEILFGEDHGGLSAQLSQYMNNAGKQLKGWV